MFGIWDGSFGLSWLHRGGSRPTTGGSVSIKVVSGVFLVFGFLYWDPGSEDSCTGVGAGAAGARVQVLQFRAKCASHTASIELSFVDPHLDFLYKTRSPGSAGPGPGPHAFNILPSSDHYQLYWYLDIGGTSGFLQK